ncbi:mPR-like GPCR protein [Nemania sp. FL0031]|nr:mPR-like GPCR protein [Nemania sp. FL0031]
MKKQHVRDANTAKPRTVTWHEIPERKRDNKYILSGYRPEKVDYLEVLASLTFLHNETCNVYTHLIGALLLPLVATAFMRALSEPRFFNVSGIDYAMFGIFFFCAECCLLFSATYHLVESHSYDVERFWDRIDLLGIIIVTVGTFIPGIHYVFACEPGLQKLHWAIIVTSGAITAALVSIPKLGALRWRRARLGAFVALGGYMLQYLGMKLYLLELVFYGSGACFYVVGFSLHREKFDIWGSSHQIFHVAILCAMYTHALALTQAFTAFHTLDLCSIQVAYR